MKPLPPYLKIIKTQLMTTLRPAEGAMSQRVAHYATQILATLSVELEIGPQLEQASLQRYRALLTGLRAELPLLEGGSTLAAALEDTLRDATTRAQVLPLLSQAAALLAKAKDPAAQALVKEFSAIELDMQNARHAAVAAACVLPVLPNESRALFSVEQTIRLRAYLRSLSPEDSALDIGDVRAIPGGFAKQTVFVDLRGARRLPSQVVLRMDKPDTPVDSKVTDEFSLIHAMFEAGVPVPEPFAKTDDSAILGAPFLVLARIQGENIGDMLDVFRPSRECGLSLAKTVAAIHQVPLSKGAHLPGANMSPRERVARDIDNFEQKWRATGAVSVSMELALAWLKANLAYADGKPVIIHREVGCHNMLVRDNQVAAVLDWETAVIGSAAQELGYLYNVIAPMLPWEEFLAAYEQHGGESPSQKQVDFYRLWTAVWLNTLATMARSYVENDLSSDAGLAWVAQYYMQRMQHMLDELLNLNLANS